MPAAISQETRDTVKKRLENGVKTKDIAAEFHFSISKACGMKRLWKETGEVWQQPTGTTGRPHVIGDGYLERLREYLDRNPDALMRDIADFLNDECSLDVTVSTVWRTLVRLGWKENRPRAKDRDSLGQWKASLPRDEEGKPMYGPVKDRGKVKLPKKRRPTPQEALLNRVQIFVQNYMSQPRFDASHDYSHILRVVDLSRHLLRAELAENPYVRYDQMVIELAALMHDVNDHKYTPRTGEQQPSPSGLLRMDPTQPDQETSSLSSAPHDGTLPSVRKPSHAPYGHVPQTPSQGASNEQPGPSRQSPNLQVDPSLQPLPQTAITPSNHHSSPPKTPQTAQIQNQPALQPISPNSQKDTSWRPQRTVEEHLLRLRTPAALATPVSAICSAISYSHEIHNPAQAASILTQYPELAIVQDADRLDALGAVGIGRAFAFGATHSRPLENTIEHMDEKLSRLEGMMKTGEGRRLARARMERINAFRSWWEEEGGGVGLGLGDAGGSSTEIPRGGGEDAMDVSMDGGGGGAHDNNNNNPNDNSWPGRARSSGPPATNGYNLHSMNDSGNRAGSGRAGGSPGYQDGVQHQHQYQQQEGQEQQHHQGQGQE